MAAFTELRKIFESAQVSNEIEPSLDERLEQPLEEEVQRRFKNKRARNEEDLESISSGVSGLMEQDLQNQASVEATQFNLMDLSPTELESRLEAAHKEHMQALAN
eukprot:6563575-Karenia_brevis.AAC.1